MTEMSFSRKLKQQLVKHLVDEFKKHTSFLLVNYTGLTAPQSSDLRKHLKSKSINLLVLKNSIIKKVMSAISSMDFSNRIKGMNAVVYGNDPVEISKEILSFIAKNKVLKIKTGLIDGRILEESEIRKLSTLPSREQLLSQTCGYLAYYLTSIIKNSKILYLKLLWTLEALKEKQKG